MSTNGREGGGGGGERSDDILSFSRNTREVLCLRGERR